MTAAATLFAGNVFYWQGAGNLLAWGDPANWSLVKGSYSNPSSLVPGSAADDQVYVFGYTYSGDYGTLGYFDLGGVERVIDGFSRGSANGTVNKNYKLHLRNGTLRVNSPVQFDNVSSGFEVYNGATLLLATNNAPKSIYRTAGMYSHLNVQDGARIEVRGKEFCFADVSSVIYAVGTLLFDPDKFSLHNSHGNRISRFEVYGRLEAPRGMKWNGTDVYTSSINNSTVPRSTTRQKRFHVTQYEGSVVLMGGDFAKTVEESANTVDGFPCEYKYFLAGGTLVASNSVKFYNATSRWGVETTAAMTNSATVEVLADSTLDMGDFTYTPGVTLTKDGPGMLKVRAMPPAIQVVAGPVTFYSPITDLTGSAFASGSKIVFGTTGNAFTLSDYANVDFAIAPDINVASADLLTSTDPAFLAHVQSALASSVPSGYGLSLSGNTLSIVVDPAAVFYWKGSPRVWTKWNDPANWSVSQASAYNPAAAVPGTPDVANRIWAYGCETRNDGDYNNYYGMFDLDGGSYTLTGFAPGATAGRQTWHCQQFHVTNGTLRVEQATPPVSNEGIGYFVWNGAMLELCAPGRGVTYDDCTNWWGVSGLYDMLTVKNGGRATIFNFIPMYNYKAVVQAGGTLEVKDGRFFVGRAATANRPMVFENSGKLILPNGLNWTGEESTSNSGDLAKQFRLDQKAGEVVFGGDFKKSGEESTSSRGKMTFNFSGGVLSATNSVAFLNPTIRNGQETFAEVAAGASVEVRALGADSVLDMRLFTYGAGVTVTKTGAGRVVVSDRPATLTVNEGAVEFGVPVTELTGVTLANGVKMVFGARGNAFTLPDNWEQLAFGINGANFAIGDTVVTSENEDFLAYVAAQIAGDAPAQTTAVVQNGAVKLVSDNVNVFTAEGTADIGDPAKWRSGTVPTNCDVVVSGSATVARIMSGSASFRSIQLVDGATLQVEDGVDLPPVALSYPATLRFAEGSSMLTNGFECAGDASGLPIIEVATNATCAVAPGTVFKNVDLRLYGTVTTEENRMITFGGADNGEVTYFTMTAIGGTIRLGAWKGTAISEALVRFVTPAAGGVVTVTRPIMLKDTTLNVYRPGYSTRGYCGMLIGYNNPTAYPFSLVLDCSFWTLYRANILGGSASVCVTNGATLKVAGDHPGVATYMDVTDNASITVDGADSRLLLENADPYRNSFQSAAANTIALRLRNGGQVAAHNTKGNMNSVCLVEDGTWGVPNLPYLPVDYNPCPTDRDPRNWMSDLFKGFASVNIPAGKTLRLVSEDVLGAAGGAPESVRYWNRNVKFANVPITGAGGVEMVNDTPGYAFTATIVSGANTATGEISVDTSAADPTRLLFADGANWVGTVVSGGIGFTNVVAGASPARATFAALRLEGALPIRVWEGQAGVTNDTFDVTDSLIVNGGMLQPESMTGAFVADKISIAVGTIPAAAELPPVARKWKASATTIPSSGRKLVILTYNRPGIVVNFR